MSYGPDISKWDRRRRYEQKHRDLGLCSQCSEPAVNGTSYCEKHLVSHRKHMKEIYEKRKAERLCVHCGRPLHEEDENYVCHGRSSCKPSRRQI